MKNLHIGIILDGNRRFAQKAKKKLWEGHEAGARKVESLFDWGRELGIKELTLYCFSLENFNRTREEVNFLMELIKKWFMKLEKDSKIEKNKIKIRFIGQKELLDNDLQKLMKRIERKTEKYNDYVINFAIAYGGRQEILSAIKKIVAEKKEINEKSFQESLWLSDYPDLIIRTGGEKRTSNFLPWQSVYSEWIFSDKMWPEFTKEDLKEAIEEFDKRERRFGK
ncbi:MAG: polyprenyl diphosphate synthase [Candidatus Pacearchaeota archaeon]|nr:polyprenyl diphosphate synthase [Candidatus Pacearchaeota archaeon]